MKIFGIGLNKTGTKTLARCLRTLGYRHTSGSEVHLEEVVAHDSWTNLFTTIDRYDSFDDIPYFLIYEKLDRHFPGSKFILTLRKDPATWLTSFQKHCERHRLKNDGSRVSTGQNRLLAYGYRFLEGHEEAFLEIYRKHEENVKTYFAKKPRNLLTVCWENGDGWEKLCAFLEKPVPAQPFPWENKAATPR
ncbi:MAG TPA: sulfotransferase [Candidatus Omnitrophota bacterium]|nr:sulfotransferase [Candidatus Omnitrophota bacterium]HPS36986.1 sulfotransferase [Candidatus Omnitrophota bacterium]